LPVRYKRAPQVAQTINQVVEMIAQDESQNTIKGTLRVVADEETNVLFVYTRKSNVVFVTSLLTVLDVVTAPDSVAKAVHLQHAKATHVKDILGQLIGNRPAGGSQITIVADDRTNMLMILATKADIEALEKFIQPFDVDSADSAAAATSASCATTNRPLEKDSGQPGVGR
jgi:type II secretory pathway component GspD/PulD (secretin)